MRPFRTQHGVEKTLVLSLFFLINGLVLFNALFHDPRVGYDSESHFAYIDILSRCKLPAPAESPEFFSPPLPYLLPALVRACGAVSVEVAGKFAQLLNAAYSVVLTFYLLKICERLRPGNGGFKVMSLALLGMLPVYYKTFSFVRPEPLLAMLAAILAYMTLILRAKDGVGLVRLMAYGVLIGLIALTRQWGFFLITGAFIFLGLVIVKHRKKRRSLIKAMALSSLIALIASGWFYFHLYRDYGTVAAFNRHPSPRFSFENQPREFYASLAPDKLFSDPVRKSFPNQFVPIFYSELWGDYWSYFIVYGWNKEDRSFVSGLQLEQLLAREPWPAGFTTNRFGINAYLGRVNLVSLLPTAVLLAGFFAGVAYLYRFARSTPAQDADAGLSLSTLCVAISVAGYAWFLIRYPNLGKGDTIKATYLLQIYPFIAILSADVLLRLKAKSRATFTALAIALALIALHNAPAMITRYTPW